MMEGKGILRFCILPVNGISLACWLALYLLLHAAGRLFFSETLQFDDAEQVVAGQELALGYDMPQPPLYTWIYWLASRWLGVGLPVLSLIKYTMIGVMFLVLWKIARHFFTDTAWRTAAVLSFLLLPMFAWHMHVGFTHTILMMLACAMTFHALLRLYEQPGWISCAYLALAVSTGLLSKYGYHLYLGVLLAALLSLPDWRRILLRKGPLLAIIFAVAAATPYHLWVYEHWDWVVQKVSTKFSGEHHLALGKWKILRPVMAMLEYLFPLLLVLLWAAPKFFRLIGSIRENHAVVLLTRFHLILIALAAAAMLTMNLDYVKSRWMTPFLFLTPVWLVAHAQNEGPRAVLRLTGAATALSLLILAGRLGDFIVSPSLGGNGRVHLPVVKTLSVMPEACREASAYLAFDNFIAAHARVSWPAKTVYSFAVRPVHRTPLAGSRLAVISTEEDVPWSKVREYVDAATGESFVQARVRSLGKTEAYNGRVKFTLYCSLLEKA